MISNKYRKILKNSLRKENKKHLIKEVDKMTDIQVYYVVKKLIRGGNNV